MNGFRRRCAGGVQGRTWALLLAVTALGAFCALRSSRPASACNIPVFQYALFQWPPDAFELLVLSEGPLSEKEKQAVAYVERSADKSPFANVRVTAVDLSTVPKEKRASLLGDAKNVSFPYAILRYPPYYQIPIPAWEGPFTREAAERIVDSPVRRAVAKRLLGGHAAVWVFLRSGDAVQDAACEKRLRDTLKKAHQMLELPVPPEEFPAPEEEQPENTEPARPEFSVVLLQRNDKAEDVFCSILLGTEPDLHELKEPMAFAVFGRGRVLGALVGKGINEENVAEACLFVTGPCSCNVKGMNPGVDLLMAVDWEEALEGRYSETPVPAVELTALGEAGDTENSRAAASSEKTPGSAALPEAPKASDTPQGGMLIPSLIAVAGLLFLGTAVGTVVVLRRKR